MDGDPVAKAKSAKMIPFDVLADGYIATIENAIRFFGAAGDVITAYPDKALALAQLGQEELGKSLTILSAFSLPAKEGAWKWFWDGWSNHQLKAHRAYLYELISPLRIELDAPNGKTYTGGPLRTKLSHEKESGFYVDYDQVLERFVSPSIKYKR